MRKDIEKRYIKELCKNNSKEDLAKLILENEDKICKYKAFLNQHYASGDGIVFYDCIEKLKEVGSNDLAEQLQGVQNYLSHGRTI